MFSLTPPWVGLATLIYVPVLRQYGYPATVFRGKALGGLGGVAMRVCSLSAFRSALLITNSKNHEQLRAGIKVLYVLYVLYV